MPAWSSQGALLGNIEQGLSPRGAAGITCVINSIRNHLLRNDSSDPGLETCWDQGCVYVCACACACACACVCVERVRRHLKALDSKV